jgi:FkbH-like protein
METQLTISNPDLSAPAMDFQDDLRKRLEAFLGSAEKDRSYALATLTKAVRLASAEGDKVVASECVLRAVLPDLDYTSLTSLLRLWRSLPRGNTSGPTIRLAVLGGFTTHQLVDFLDLFLAARGIRMECYEADYRVMRQEVLDPGSALYSFRPNIVLLATTWRDLVHRPTLESTREQVQNMVAAEVGEWSRLWKMIQQGLGAQVIQNSFDTPAWRVLGNYENRHPASLGRYIGLVNQALADAAPSSVLIHDVATLAANAGRWTWGDERFHYHAKLPCPPESLGDYAHSLAANLAAMLGLGKKCLVLDLDNTLWGGVIGDDGIGGIRIGQGNPEAEAFHAFQTYVRALRERGVILAVCSKNEELNAREPFEKHPEMVLRNEDISMFVANWTDKATNLRNIAKGLNIGLNSLVFFDDNPVERSLIRRALPEVEVPEVPPDPAAYIRALERHRFFEVVSLGSEDFKRTDLYHANAAREQAEVAAGSLDDFLKSLQMKARVRSIDDTSLDRAAQLIARSNQFNLTTRRYSPAQIDAFRSANDWITRVIRLEDRFGDNGLISVVLGKIERESLRIDTWVMSCRVLKRGVEQLVLDHLRRLASGRGLKSICGEFIPTAKNGLVRDHYSKLQFTKVGEEPDGSTRWEFLLAEGQTSHKTYIEEVGNE